MTRSSINLLVLIVTTTAWAQPVEPLLLDLTKIRFQPGEVTTKDKAKVAAGTTELTPGKFGQALRFSFVEATGTQLFTASVKPGANWDQSDGFSFWVKGDGSTNCGGLELIDRENYALRYGYCFSIASTNWGKVTVPWSDLTPELSGPLVDPAHGLAPARFGNFWVGKWSYWREYPACSFTLDHVVLEKQLPRAPVPSPALSPLARTLAKLKAKQPVTIVTLGDSLTDKRHWANREKLWAEELVKRLTATYGGPVQLVNPALGGTTLSQNTVLIPRWLQATPQHDLVTIWFGYNDWDCGVRGERYQDYLRAVVDRLRRATQGQVEIVLLTTCPSPARWEMMQELVEAVRVVAREKKIALVDVAAEFHKLTPEEALRQNYFAWDKVHLGAKGHEVTCEAVLKAIQAASQ